MGCAVGGTGLDVQVVSATFSDYQALAMVMIGGATWGDGTMVFTDDAGDTRQVQVAFAGPSAGLVMDVHVAQKDFLFEGWDSAKLEIPEGGVAIDDVFGLYGGGGLALGLGYCDLAVSNDASVRLVIEGACGGMGFARSENWLTMTADGQVTDVEAS
jgi:hypothetical protein